jgi:hypothetical protein
MNKNIINNTDNNTNTNNKTVFRFPYFDGSFEYEKLKLEQEKAKLAAIIAKDPKTHKIQIGKGILPDQTAFNKMFDAVLNVNRHQRNIKKKIKYLPLNIKYLDYNDLTIKQLKKGLYIDFFDMCNELLLMEKFSLLNFNNIISKNYRKIILLLILLISIVISYIIINFLNQK